MRDGHRRVDEGDVGFSWSEATLEPARNAEPGCAASDDQDLLLAARLATHCRGK
jgi:hypothetical protein